MCKGEVQEYRAHIHSDQIVQERDEGRSVSTLADLVIMQKVIDVQLPDTYGLQVTVASGTVKRGGEVERISTKGQSFVMQLKKSGEIAQTSAVLPYSPPAFPDRSLRQGDTWSVQSELTVPFAGSDGQMEGVRREPLTYNYSLWGFSRLLGYDCAQIHVVCPQTRIELSSGIAQVVSAAGTTFFAYKEGKMVRSEVETTNVFSSPDSTITSTVKVIVDIHEAASTGMAVGGEEFIIR